MLQELPETTAILCGFPPRAFGFCIRNTPRGVVHLLSDRLQPDYEVAKGSLVEERAKRTLVREEVDLAADSGSGTSLIGAAGAPMENLAHRWVTYEVCSSIVLVTSGAANVVTTAPGAVPLQVSPSFSEIDG